MNDSISRKALLDHIDKCVSESGADSPEYDPVMTVHDIKKLISVEPAADAVPIVPLCGLLEKIGGMTCGYCEDVFPKCPEIKTCGSKEHWKMFLTKWMEGLDAAD